MVNFCSLFGCLYIGGIRMLWWMEYCLVRMVVWVGEEFGWEYVEVKISFWLVMVLIFGVGLFIVMLLLLKLMFIQFILFSKKIIIFGFLLVFFLSFVSFCWVFLFCVGCCIIGIILLVIVVVGLIRYWFGWLYLVKFLCVVVVDGVFVVLVMRGRVVVIVIIRCLGENENFM